MRWIWQMGGRWLVQQVWQGVRGGDSRREQSEFAGDTPVNSEHEPLREKGSTCALGVVCSSRRLFDGLADLLSRKRVIVADGFRVAHGFLSGAMVVVAMPTRADWQAKRVVAALVNGHHPLFLVAVGEGCSGGGAVAEGHVVVATELHGPNGQRLELEGRVPLADWIHRGRVDAVAGIPGEPLAIDEWSWENAVACRSLEIPLVALTAITLPCAERQSPGTEVLRPGASLARRTGSLTGMAWRRPRELKRVWQLQSATWQACDRMVKLVSLMADATRDQHRAKPSS